MKNCWSFFSLKALEHLWCRWSIEYTMTSFRPLVFFWIIMITEDQSKIIWRIIRCPYEASKSIFEAYYACIVVLLSYQSPSVVLLELHSCLIRAPVVLLIGHVAPLVLTSNQIWASPCAFPPKNHKKITKTSNSPFVRHHSLSPGYHWRTNNTFMVKTVRSSTKFGGWEGDLSLDVDKDLS